MALAFPVKGPCVCNCLITSPTQLLAHRPSNQHGNNCRLQERDCGWSWYLAWCDHTQPHKWRHNEGTEAVPTQAVWQPFSGATPCKRGFPATWNSATSKPHPCWVLSLYIPHGVLPSETLGCTSVSIQDFAVMRARHVFSEKAKMLELQGKEENYRKIQKLSFLCGYCRWQSISSHPTTTQWYPIHCKLELSHQ